MRSSLLVLALLPLVLAQKTACKCPFTECPNTEPELCKCLNANAIRCAKFCGQKPPILQDCSQPTLTSTTNPTSTPTPAICGSRGLAPCPKGQICIANPAKPGCDPRADCPGICVPDRFCGGIAGIPCPASQICVDNPNDDCDPTEGGADCGGVCAPKPPTACGGFLGIPCEGKGEVCVDDPSDDCDPKNGGADCPGICVGETGPGPILSVRAAPKFASCGGFTGKPCANPDLKCVDDPRDSCDPKKGGADCPGICVGKACGGFAGLKCKVGQTCVDDPRDNCDPKNGGADCIGVCI